MFGKSTAAEIVITEKMSTEVAPWISIPDILDWTGRRNIQLSCRGRDI
jgi:hypothetical protein